MSRSLIPNSTQIPDVIIDQWMARLTGSEFKIILYIARRTYGFGKESDSVSINQISRGIRRRDGEWLDRGTGLSRSGVKAACATLVATGLLIKTRAIVEGSREPDENEYRLNLYAPLPSIRGDKEGGKDEEAEPEDKVGQTLTQLGQESAYLGSAGNHSKKVGQDLAHVGQESTDVGQEPDQGRSGINRGVGQRLAPQETEQETDQQETATSSPGIDPSAASAVASSPSAEGEAERLLTEAGFSASVARSLAHHGAEAVQRQVEALPKRKVGKNRLGMLRKAIEEGWEIPQTPQEARAKDERIETKAHQERQEARERAQTERARETLAQLRTAAPEAFSAFLEFVGEKKRRALAGDIGKRSAKAQLALEQIYDSEEKQFELLPEFLAKHPQGRELSPFLAAAA